MDFWRPILSLCILVLFGVSRATQDPRYAAFSSSDIIDSDVCIIGGGSSGTYSAIRLRQMGKTVTLIEKEPILGGHVNTFIDPVTGLSLDYGVITFGNISVVTKYFDHFQIPLAPTASGASGTQVSADFKNGNIVPASALPQGNLPAALIAYGDQLARFPFLINGFNLPSPVPEDLLLTYGDFIEKFELEALAYLAFTLIEGVGNILAQPTLYIMKYFSALTLQSILENSFLTTAHHNNQELYNKALAELGSDAHVSSNVTDIDRSDDGVQVIVSTPSGQKLIKASKLLIAIQPKLESLNFLDLDDQERDLFGQFNNSFYWDALVRNSGIPDNITLSNVDLAASLALPPMPGIYGISATAIPGIHTVYYSSDHVLSDEEVQKDILATIERLVKVAGYPPVNGTTEFAGFNNHAPFELTVSTDAIRSGFYQRLNGLQGKRRTWWTGATWQAHDSSLIWNFTESNILPGLLT